MLAGETLSLYMNLFSSNDYKKNDKIRYKYFNDKYDRRGKPWFWLKNRWNKKLSIWRNKKHNELISKKYTNRHVGI